MTDKKILRDLLPHNKGTPQVLPHPNTDKPPPTMVLFLLPLHVGLVVRASCIQSLVPAIDRVGYIQATAPAVVSWFDSCAAESHERLIATEETMEVGGITAMPGCLAQWASCDEKLWSVMPPGARRDLTRFARDGKDDLARRRIATIREIAELAYDLDADAVWDRKAWEQAVTAWEAAVAAAAAAEAAAAKAAKAAKVKAAREAREAASK